MSQTHLLTSRVALFVTLVTTGCASKNPGVHVLDRGIQTPALPAVQEGPLTHIRDFTDSFWDHLSNWPAEISSGHYRYRLRVRVYEGGRSASYELYDEELARLRKEMGWDDDMDEEQFPWSFTRFNFGPTYGWSARDHRVVRRGVDHPEMGINHYYGPDGVRFKSLFSFFTENRAVSMLYDRLGEVVAFWEGPYYDHLAYEGRDVVVVRSRRVPRAEFSRLFTLPWSEFEAWRNEPEEEPRRAEPREKDNGEE